MIERCSFRLSKGSAQAYMELKEWCRANRVPMGRILNAALQAMQDLPPYHPDREATITIPYPPQTNIDAILRYNKVKARLTRVSK